MNVVFFCQADYAGSAYQAVSAINRIGRIRANQITCAQSPWNFEAGVVIPVVGWDYHHNIVESCNMYEKACELLEKADLIHCWNDEYKDFFGPKSELKAFSGEFPRYDHKYKSCTFTGTWYRRYYGKINERLKRNNTKLVVQTPAFIMDSIKSVFIPHAIDTDAIKPLPIKDRKEKTIGCYPHGKTTANRDIQLLKEELRKFPGWRIILEERAVHKERLRRVAKCMFFMQDMDTRMISYGRSTVEAAAMGIPVLNSVHPMAKKLMSDLSIIEINPETLGNVLKETIEANYQELSEKIRKWVIKYHSYEVIGEKYTKFFENLV